MLTPVTLTSSAAWSQPSGLLKTLLSRPQFPHLKITSRASSGLWDGGRGVFTLRRLFCISPPPSTWALLGSWLLQFGVRSKNHSSPFYRWKLRLSVGQRVKVNRKGQDGAINLGLQTRSPGQSYGYVPCPHQVLGPHVSGLAFPGLSCGEAHWEGGPK